MTESAWQGSRVIVTGASSGIGAAIGRELARHRARLVLTGRSLPGLDREAAECERLGGEVETVHGDLTDAVVQRAVIDTARERFGGLDMLVNNAGISMNAGFADADPEVMREIFEINVFAVEAVTRLALADLVASRGRIVVISSVTGLVGAPTRSFYASSKHALHGLFDALRVELRRDGVSVTVVCPGLVRTEVRKRALMADGTPQGRDDALGKRMMSPDRVARLTLAAAARRRRRLLLGAETHVARWLSIAAPGALDAILARMRR